MNKKILIVIIFSASIVLTLPREIQSAQEITIQGSKNTATEINFKAATGKVYTLSDFMNKSFDAKTAFEKVIQQNKNVIVDFYAPWCGPCRRMSPIFEKYAQSFLNVLFIKIDVDQYNQISNHYNIKSIPSIFYFKNGERIGQTIGYNPEKVKNNIKRLFN